jgi:hypothetical protein
MKEVNEMFGKIFADIQKVEREREEAEAKKNPEAYRNSQVMERGKSVRFHYYQLPRGHARKGETVMFCYTQHRNVAGYYLSFTRIEGPMRGRGRNRSATIVQRNFHGWKTKANAIADCKYRFDDARKPAELRTFVVPTMKDHFKKPRKRKPKQVATQAPVVV